MRRTSVIAGIALSSLAIAQQSTSHNISMVFTDTDASLALTAVSLRTGANIVYANKTKVTVTMKLNATSVEEAVRSVCAAAGLVYKRTGSVYVVSNAAGMKDALAPYSHTIAYLVAPGAADGIVTRLTELMPYVTAKASGDRVLVTALPEDARASADIIRRYNVSPPTPDIVKRFVLMHQLAASDVAPIIKSFYPDITITATAAAAAPETAAAAPPPATPGAAAAPAGPASNPDRFLRTIRGAIGMVGPRDQVDAALRTLAEMDKPEVATGPDEIVSEVYVLKYVTAPSLETFLRRAAPEIDVYAGPESTSPKRGIFNPTSGLIAGSVGAASGSGGGGGSVIGTQTPTGQIIQGARAKAVVLKGKRKDVDNAMKMVADLDVKPKLVKIEVNVIETSPTDAEQIGLGYTFSPISFFEVPAGTALTAGAAGTTLGTTNTRPAGFGSISRSPFNFNTALSALVTHQKAKILSSPSIEVVDQDDAFVFVGNTSRVEVSTAGALGATSQNIFEFPVGIILLFSPRVNSDGTVMMHVNPAISSITSVDADGIPQTATREADTSIIVKDGETVVLGGLIQDQDTKTISEVPFLSQIPLIGELFKNRNTSHARTEVVVSITTHIISDPKPEGS